MPVPALVPGVAPPLAFALPAIGPGLIVAFAATVAVGWWLPVACPSPVRIGPESVFGRIGFSRGATSSNPRSTTA